MARWGMPSPLFALKGRNSDPGVTIESRRNGQVRVLGDSEGLRQRERRFLRGRP